MSISVVIMLQIAFQYKLFAWTQVLLTSYSTTVETTTQLKKTHTHKNHSKLLKTLFYRLFLE